MDFEKKAELSRRELAKLEQQQKKLDAKLAEVLRQKRAAKNKLLNSTSRHPYWHGMKLSAHDREIGFDGAMADAHYELRNRTFTEYLAAIKPIADAMPGASVAEIEFAAVSQNLEEWTKMGEAALFEKARGKYLKECAEFARWTEEHPDEKHWRDWQPTRAQWMLIQRTAERLGVNMPIRLTCGAAHDWLEANGANLRFMSDFDPVPSSVPPETPNNIEQDDLFGDHQDDIGEGW